MIFLVAFHGILGGLQAPITYIIYQNLFMDNLLTPDFFCECVSSTTFEPSRAAKAPLALALVLPRPRRDECGWEGWSFGLMTTGVVWLDAVPVPFKWFPVSPRCCLFEAPILSEFWAKSLMKPMMWRNRSGRIGGINESQRIRPLPVNKAYIDC